MAKTVAAPQDRALHNRLRDLCLTHGLREVRLVFLPVDVKWAESRWYAHGLILHHKIIAHAREAGLSAVHDERLADRPIMTGFGATIAEALDHMEPVKWTK